MYVLLQMALVLWPFVPPAAPDSQAPPDFEAAAEYSRRHGGRAFVVIQGDAVKIERWQNGARDTFAQTIFSGTKSFGCALAALSVGDGRMALDERVSDTFAELAGRETSAAIRPRDLLTQTSGMKGGGTSTRGDHFQWIRNHARQLTGTAPGARFTYGAAHWDLFSAFAREKLGEDPIAYLERRVLQPLGITPVFWKADGVGQRFLAFGLVTTPRAWARYGMLLRDRGVADGKRLLPAEAVADCWQGTTANPAYGFGLWLNRPMPKAIKSSIGYPTTLRRLIANDKDAAILPGGPDDLAMAAGSADTRLYIIPSRDLVIVRFGYRDDPSFSDAALLRPLLLPGGAGR